MASPLVETKLYVPRLRRSVVARPRLSGRLSRGAEARLTLISAPAGFGKTTLLAAWLAAAGAQDAVGGVAVPRGERQPARDVLDLRDHRPADGRAGRRRRRAPAAAVGRSRRSRPSSPRCSTSSRAVPNDVDLVLDDYHLVDGPDIRRRHGVPARAPPAARPPGDQHPSRPGPAAGSPARARRAGRGPRRRPALHPRRGGGLPQRRRSAWTCTAQDIAALEGRTEGWIAALQLAALSMQGRDDIGGFIAGFAGDDRYIVDYLVEEVLQRQPDEVRDFLLAAPRILDRLSGPLCDAVTGEPGGKAMLEALDRANLFVVPLDDSRRWYRYHHLFADVLRAHLLDERPDEVADLHRRASQWYDAERASRRRRSATPWPPGTSSGRRTWSSWPSRRCGGTGRRPPSAAGSTSSPTRWSGAAGARRRLRRGADGRRRVRRRRGAPAGRRAVAGRTGAPTTARHARSRRRSMVVVDEERARPPPGRRSRCTGPRWPWSEVTSPATIRHAQLAIDRAADERPPHPGRGVGPVRARALGRRRPRGRAPRVLRLRRGAAAGRAHRRRPRLLDHAGRHPHHPGPPGRRAAHLRAGAAARRRPGTGTVLRGTADMYVGMSQIACERDDLDAATAHLLRSQELGEHAGLPQNPYRWRVAMARVREAQGDLAGALGLLDEAQRVYTGDFSPNVRPVPALRARVLAAQGRVGEALAWAARAGPVRRRRPVVPARVRARHPRPGAAGPAHGRRRPSDSLRRGPAAGAPAARRRGGRPDRDVIEILVLQALAHHARGDTAGRAGAAGACADPGRAGGLRPRVRRRGTTDGRPAAAPRPPSRRIAPSYVRRLLAAAATRSGDRRTPPRQGLDRAAERTRAGRAAAARQPTWTARTSPASSSVSLNTVRTHTKNIYAKLGVNSRRAAVRRAEELDLLSRSPRPLTAALARRAAGIASRKSPRRSPHVVMSAHHIRSYLAVIPTAPAGAAGSTRRSAMSDTSPPTHEPGRYEIRLKGHLDARWAAWFDGMTLTARRRRHHRHPRPGRRPGRAARPAPEVRDLGLPLVSVTQVDPTPIEPPPPPSRTDRTKETDMTTTARTQTDARVPMDSPRRPRSSPACSSSDHLRHLDPRALFLYAPVLDDPDYIVGAGADTGVALGAFLEVILIVANIGTAVVLFPVLKRQNEALALGYRHGPRHRERLHRRRHPQPAGGRDPAAGLRRGRRRRSGSLVDRRRGAGRGP